ncbi:hypothetical protein Tco_0408211 [Tanacetum coccineum]
MILSRYEETQVYGTITRQELTNEDIRNSESYKEYYVIASGKIPPKTKASKKKADSDATTKQKPPTVPKEKKGKKTGKGKQKAKELKTILWRRFRQKLEHTQDNHQERIRKGSYTLMPAGNEVLNLDSSWTEAYRQENLQVKGRIQNNLLDMVSAAALSRFVTGALKADRPTNLTHRFFQLTTSLSSYIISGKSPTRACLMLAQEGFPSHTVNTKEYHSDVLAINTRIWRGLNDNQMMYK